jgi:muramoyltetrapeptide carboxypeptidase
MKALPPGGTIGVAAPASPYDARSEVLRGVEWWESQGYKVKLSEHIYARDDYVAGDPKDRAEDLVAIFKDPDVDVVQALQGGYGSAQAIPHLDFGSIGANPKPFVGFSDITALHVAIRNRTGMPTIYATASSASATRSARSSRASGCFPSSAATSKATCRRTRTTRTFAPSEEARSPPRSWAAASGS